MLRVDRDLNWLGIALVLLGESADADAGAVKRKGASLRKQFERLKELAAERLAD